jgi:hypothetical protein
MLGLQSTDLPATRTQYQKHPSRLGIDNRHALIGNRHKYIRTLNPEFSQPRAINYGDTMKVP